ncbi:unnamed protein product [Adineta ricciae]|uniref:Uncharacterized protein n=1 Tax=Adineta ricciae TaxID=249248 RepID=A0A815H414_ADIRI|nr:unnamed protein product [Adineta ricciae]CAF1384932.1 unnamed protein product [Adineta ricciae]
MSEATRRLVKLVRDKARSQDACRKAQQLLQQGADIKAPIKNQSMIDYIIAEEQRCRIPRPWEADCCLHLVEVLRQGASDQLRAHVFAGNDGNLDEMRQLVQLQASCYQGGPQRPLGLLGDLINERTNTIRLDVAKFLVENDIDKQYSWFSVDTEGKTCVCIAKDNPNCPKNVVDYLQQHFDIILSKIPRTKPEIDQEQIVACFRRGARLETVDEDGNTVLSNAVIMNNLELVNVLLSLGSQLTHRNKNGLTPLQIAENATSRNPPLVAILQKQAVNIELKDLIEAKGSHLTTDEVRRLLDKGVNINAKMENGNSFLHILISNDGTPDMIITFVNDFHADLSTTNIDGYRPIETCIMKEKHPYARLTAVLKLSKLSMDMFNNVKLNKTLLQFANDQNRTEAGKLVQNELNLRLWSCVMRISTNAEQNKILMAEIEQLIRYGAQINYKHQENSYSEWTALHLVCQMGSKSFVQFVIEHFEADYTLKNSNGDCPISLAAENGHLMIVEYLRGLPNTNLNIFNKDQQTPLHLATKNHHLLVVRYLVQWGADHQALNQWKQTPLNIAQASQPKNKEEEIIGKKLVQLLQRLVCPPVHGSAGQSIDTKQPELDLDTCELGSPVNINPISMINEDAEGERGKTYRENILANHPNDILHDAAKKGNLFAAQKALSDGANIRHRNKPDRTPYEVAHRTAAKCATQLNSPLLDSQDRLRLQGLLYHCQEIIKLIQQTAQNKISQAIDSSNAGLVMAYHAAGATLTPELFSKACNASGSETVEIVDYLLRNSEDIQKVVSNYSSSDSPYHIAKKNGNTRLASYFKYQLSMRCTKAIMENSFLSVQKLVHDGASVDMVDTNNLQQALAHQNTQMIQLLCRCGAKMPSKWLAAKDIVLSPAESQQFKPEIRFIINQCLIDSRLRFAAANGDLNCLILCQRLGANINSVNCHGSTALLYALKYSHSFPVVHALVSRGASILHFNEDEPKSLIQFAKRQNCQQIASYLFQELNAQFLSAILNNDRQSATTFAQFGADFNYQDEQGRTPLHYAVQYHGIELVTWLHAGGSVANKADINGDYPIILATERGDYATVEHFVKHDPNTKQQTNKSGLTALQIAQKLGFTRIAQLILTGESVPESSADAEEIRLDREVLKNAAEKGEIKVMQEFVKQPYESREEKRKLCHELLKIARRANQLEIVRILESYYNTKPISNEGSGGNVRLSEYYQKVLLGFLSGISGIIADSRVDLDPTDPATYRELFSDLTSRVNKYSQELQQVNSEQDLKKLIEKDSAHTNKRIAELHKKLEEVLESKDSLEASIEDLEQRVHTQEKSTNITAIQRKEYMVEREALNKKLSEYDSSILLLKRREEALLMRRNTINFIKNNSNLALFHQTIENRLDALFTSVFAAEGGYAKRETIIPFMNLLLTNVKSTLNPILSKLNEKVQRQEWHAISTLGNIEELKRIASDTAGIITLYYKEQIQLIDPFRKIKGTNMFNTRIKWIKNVFYDARPEGSEEMAITMFAEYVTAWIIDALKASKTELIATESLPAQLWLFVAKKNPMDQGTTVQVTDAVGVSAGQQRIPLKIRNSFGKDEEKQAQLRHLIGCVSVLGSNGHIYQYSKPTNSSDHELVDLEIFGYVYVKPFSSDKRVLDAIVDGRKLVLAKRDTHGDILTKFEEIALHAQTYADQIEQFTGESSVNKEITKQVAETLQHQHIFASLNHVDEELKKLQETVELDIDVLREDIERKVRFYQVSIDAAHEQIKIEAEANRKALAEEMHRHYEKTWQDLNEQFQNVQQHLGKFVADRLTKIEKYVEENSKKIEKEAETARSDSRIAVAQSGRASEIAQQAAQDATQAALVCGRYSKLLEQQYQEFQKKIQICETTINQKAAAQEEFCKHEIAETCDTIRSKCEQARKAVQDVQSSTRQQLDIQKEEKEILVNEVHKARVESQKVAVEAKRAANAAAEALGKVEKALERIQKATRL